MKKCTRDDLEYPDDRRFCAKCGAALVDEFDQATMIMPQINSAPARFIETNDDQSFRLSIRDGIYELSLAELKTLAAEACATVRTAERDHFRHTAL